MLVCPQLIVKICDTSACLVEVWVLLSAVLFCYLFLLKNAKSRKVLVVTFILPMQSMGYNHALYFIRGDQVDGRNFLLVGCHCIVNMLYYYYCHNIVLVNKLACLQGMICVNRLLLIANNLRHGSSMHSTECHF